MAAQTPSVSIPSSQEDSNQNVASSTVNTPQSSSSKKWSPAWDEFTMLSAEELRVIYSNGGGKSKARCNHCGTTIVAESYSGTTALNRHLKICKKRPANLGEVWESDYKIDANVVRRMLVECVIEHGYLFEWCCALILNLIVQSGLEIIKEGLLKIRECVKYVEGSEGRKIKFRECVAQAGLEYCKGLWLDVPTRWNSTYLMIERFLYYRSAFEVLSRIDEVNIVQMEEKVVGGPEDKNPRFDRKKEEYEEKSSHQGSSDLLDKVLVNYVLPNTFLAYEKHDIIDEMSETEEVSAKPMASLALEDDFDWTPEVNIAKKEVDGVKIESNQSSEILILVDNGAVVNVIPHRMLAKLKAESTELLPSDIIISGFDGGATRAKGILPVNLQVGEIVFLWKENGEIEILQADNKPFVVSAGCLDAQLYSNKYGLLRIEEGLNGEEFKATSLIDNSEWRKLYAFTPLLRLKSEENFLWNVEHQIAFEEIKKYLINPPVLMPPRKGVTFKFYVACTEKSLGAFLAQDSSEGKEQARYYLSRNMIDAELRIREENQVCEITTAKSSEDWRMPIKQYLEKPDSKVDQIIKDRAMQYCLVNDELFKKGIDGIRLKCIDDKESMRVMGVVHEGMCGSHQVGKKMMWLVKRFKMSYYQKSIDAPRAYHGLEEHNGAIGDHVLDKLGDVLEIQEDATDDPGLNTSLAEQGVEDRPPSHGATGHNRPSRRPTHGPSGHNRPLDPLAIPQGPMTRARAKRFKETLLGFVRSHLGSLESIEDHLESIEVDITKNIPIDSKVFTLLEIDEH
ncbi:putative Zinc finger, BED-type [Corchorus capsularis]|uniref:Putative Zinc finger, BED-type n=1 Tax=Corchorus capsularis TaxID=210143 RepID=A0A1R3FZD2_COCAP|nr:putative Zinc finger, BED-type [Corchorus capsularis]